MKQNKICVLTTVFPVSEPYLKKFFISLLNQTYKQFDVLVFNDGVNHISIKNPDLNIIEFIVGFSPAKNREYAIKKALEMGYSSLIFCDSDDFIEENRVEVVVNQLKSYNIVCNDIHLFYKDKTLKNYFSSFIHSGTITWERLIDSNILGFSNTAFNTQIINTDFVFSEDLIAVDWYFFTLITYYSKETVIFTNKTASFYRQHSQNTIGMREILTDEKLLLGLQVKLNHFKELSAISSIFENKLTEYEQLKKRLENKKFKNTYLQVINDNFKDIFKGWWSEILPLEEWKKYE